MTKPGIMNCIIVDNCKLSCKLLEGFVNKSPALNLIGSFSDSVEAKNTILKDNTDLIILDIQNPEMNGFDFIRSLGLQLNIIIVSSSEQFALEAFDFNVADYILKPLSYWRFCKAIDKAFKKFRLKDGQINVEKEIFIKKESSLVSLKIREIMYVEALENYVTLNKNNDRFTIHSSMKAIENQLPSEIFIRIHKSFIINKNMIHTIKEDSLNLNVGGSLKSFPVGKSFRDSLLNNTL